MPNKHFDIAILGAGFGGSLTAMLLQRSGFRVVLIDRGRHPRFAIGESSTPIANAQLAALADQYDLPRLRPLAKYGSWQRQYPYLVCGVKRGFSYFSHQPHQPFQYRSDHANQLLVAASSNDEHADTHWLRSDVDAFFAEEAAVEGVEYVDECEVVPEPQLDHWRLSSPALGGAVRAAFVIDASGEAGTLARVLGIANDIDHLKTHSRAIYCHVAGLKKWEDLLIASGGDVVEHPFPCDAAALHQFLDEGWMWQLRFNNGITSVGFALDATAPAPLQLSPTEEWGSLLIRYPSLAAQFEKAIVVQPPGGLRRTGRLQRCAAQMVGRTWAMLPNTAGFIDPLHSTGIAHSLCGLERLVRILIRHGPSPAAYDDLQSHAALQRKEIELIDRLVSGCYLARRDFRLLVPFASLYFAAATTCEHRRFELGSQAGSAYLLADDPAFNAVVARAWKRVNELAAAPDLPDSTAAAFFQEMAEWIQPYNRVGLFDPAARNLYRHTAAPA